MPIKKSPGAAQLLPGTERSLDTSTFQSNAGNLTPSHFASRAVGRPLEFSPHAPRLNHNVFRYPAKFHPPIARHLIETFSQAGDRILDPFCGSGTTLIEATVAGRSAIGTDIDPLAVFVSRAKIHSYNIDTIRTITDTFLMRVSALRLEDCARWGSLEKDAPEDEVAALIVESEISVPSIPRIGHWFRHRVVWQLGSLRKMIQQEEDGDARLFLLLCFAAIVRGSSNADPVPVSGLEVTSHMLRKETAGREIDPFRLFQRAVCRTLKAMSEFAVARCQKSDGFVNIADARVVTQADVGRVDVIITSPPYLTAVDYYRRHTLEMYWLDLVLNQRDRLELMPAYIGRDRIGGRHLPGPDAIRAAVTANHWLSDFPCLKPARERAFRHYCDGMSRSMSRMGELVPPGGKVVIVVGDVTFGGRPVSMLQLMTDLADDRLELADHLWYPIKNRYMSYTRKNEASIAADRVIVFRSR